MGESLRTAELETAIHFSANESQVRVMGVPGGWSRVLIEGCTLIGKAGEPYLPAKVLTKRLPLGSKVLSVSVVSGTVQTIVKSFRISPAPAPAFWQRELAPGQLREDPQCYR
ncbi:hypothetical protein J7M28_07550, partial [bacterium]|nr:hypothetical protein [bacterium]